MSYPQINIKILLHYVHSPDQCLVLTGSPIQLGEWNPLKGFKGELKEGFYWYFNLTVPKVGLYFDCKFVLCRKNDSNTPIEVLRWESCENRKIYFKNLIEKDGYCKQKDFWDFPTLSIYDEGKLNADPAFNFIKNEEISLKGYVLDNVKNPIPSSLVKMVGTNVTTMSMNDGYFGLKILRAQLSAILNENQEVSLKAEHPNFVANKIGVNIKNIEKDPICLTLSKKEVTKPQTAETLQEVAKNPSISIVKCEGVSIKGFVMDNVKNPIASSLVSIFGTNLTAISMKDGSFELEIPKVQLSSILNEKQEITINAEHPNYVLNKINLNAKNIDKESIYLTLLKHVEIPILTQKITKVQTDIVQMAVEKFKTQTPQIIPKIPSSDKERLILKADPAPTMTLQALDSFHPTAREKVLMTICQKLSESKTEPLPPKENSMAVDASNKNKELVKVLEAVKTSKEFLQTTESAEMTEINNQIECITGVNLVSGKQTEITKIKFESPLLGSCELMQQKNLAKLEESLRNDIAKLHGVSPKDVFIRRIVAGSIEVYFSLPESTPVNPNIAQANNLPTFKSIMTANGITDFRINRDTMLPDPLKAKEILMNYVRPVVIQTNANTHGSLLLEKFGRYLPSLSSLSTNVRIIHNEQAGTLEIHGPPAAKAGVLQYFAEMEELLQGANSLNIVIEQKTLAPPSTNSYYPNLWRVLYEEAKRITLAYVNTSNTLQTSTVRMNPNLEKGTFGARSFMAGLEHCGLNPAVTDPQTILQLGVFGWHGTPTAESVLSIAIENLDPGRRRARSGEFCGTRQEYSQTARYWGNTNTLFLFFILKNPPNQYFTFNGHYVTNNPSRNLMFMVPILVATFNNQVPLRLEPDNVQNPIPNPINNNVRLPVWQWKNDSSWEVYGVGQDNDLDVQPIIESQYQGYLSGRSVLMFTLTFKRLNDRRTDTYGFDFSTMTQKNMRTGYTRQIQRK